MKSLSPVFTLPNTDHGFPVNYKQLKQTCMNALSGRIIIDEKCAQNFNRRNLKGKDHFVITKHTQEDKEIACESVDWIYLAHGCTYEYRAFMNAVV